MWNNIKHTAYALKELLKERREKRGKKNQEREAKNIPKLIENTNLHIQGSQKHIRCKDDLKFKNHLV